MDSAKTSTIRKPFIEHIRELQTRAIWCVLAVIAGGFLGYFLNQQILEIIQRPLNQTLYYTSPTGGFSFVLKACVTFGLIVGLPVIIYHILRFIGPLLTNYRKSVIVNYMLWSIDLAYMGVLFAYFVSLPAALHFLTQFGGENIQSLITADEYFSFALAYIGGFAVLFQLPLIVIFVNRIKPMSPGNMMSGQRYVILGSFIAAAVLTPTPDPFNQLVMAVPPILLYQLSVIIVWFINRRDKKAIVTRIEPIVREVVGYTEYTMDELIGFAKQWEAKLIEETRALNSLVVKNSARKTRMVIDILPPDKSQPIHEKVIDPQPIQINVLEPAVSN